MYLKKIEAQGFKSFANKIVLEFAPGIMGIVGPNGSGKSNVADAVRWVLGEQSAKQLRGSNMQDVIFAGTESRKPMGYAYVSLTIDNRDHALPTEYDEVSVTRQVFRSGESEYRMNGNTCRLRDIYELFYDSGIGREGYSIIGQGQIDLVLSNKPEERRFMFDEAAGIVKYKKRRDITLKKLESEQASLQRINDILGELARQVGPLETQAARARSYLALRDELKACEVGAFYLEAEDLEKKLKLAEDNLSVLSGDLIRSHQESDALKARYDELSEQNQALEKTIADSGSELADLRVEKENREGRIILLKEQIKATENNRGLVDGRLETLAEEDKRIKAERQQYYDQKNALDEKLDVVDDKITSAEEAQENTEDEIRELEFRIRRRNEEALEAGEERAALAVKLQSWQTREEQLKLRKAVLGDERESALAACEEARREDEALSETLSMLREKLSAAETEDKALRTKRSEAAALLQKLRRESLQAEQDYRSVSARYDMLRNLTERYEGFGGSVRSVMELKSSYPGIKGTVADLVRTGKRYETALETALGGRMQNIVTDTEKTAKALVERLKAGKLGRATFLPMDAVNGQKDFNRKEALSEKGIIGRASELVEFEPELSGIVLSLLGQILVAENMEAALPIARKYGYKLHIVTLEGENLSPGGSISGGSYKNASNLLSRRRELDELKAQKGEALAKSKETAAALKQAEEDDIKISAAAEKSAKETESLRLKENSLALQLESRRKEFKHLEENLQRIVDEQESSGEELDTLAQNRSEGASRQSVLNEAEEKRSQESTLDNEKLDEARRVLSEQNAALEAFRVEFSGIQQQTGFVLESIRRLNGELAKNEDERKNLYEGRYNEAELIAAKKKEIETMASSIEEAGKRIAELEALGKETKELLDRQREEQQSFFDSREILTNRISDLDKESFRLQSNKQRLEEQMEKQAEYLWEEYQMTPSQARATRDPSLTNLSEVRKIIAGKKEEIRNLGPIHIDAIEEYKEVSSRYEFMKAQQEDLVRAEEELSGMIGELENGMRTRFKEQFALIQQEFSRVFRELFAGGKGTLELDGDGDVLSAGVIINAQPPGKKLQNMMQLSGGEKALTAIALLFAIQNLKPSPFCLLDEIESALDEPNVARFADYLDRLKGTTQFLVITHRRGTMEMADRLYGITMQEKGISALVSVNLTDPGARKYLDEQ